MVMDRGLSYVSLAGRIAESHHIIMCIRETKTEFAASIEDTHSRGTSGVWCSV